jgi:hypothetical protein
MESLLYSPELEIPDAYSCTDLALTVQALRSRRKKKSRIHDAHEFRSQCQAPPDPHSALSNLPMIQTGNLGTWVLG